MGWHQYIILSMREDGVSELIQQSMALEQAGEMAGALKQARQAEELARSQDDNSLLAQALVRLATVSFRMGRFQIARNLAEEALSLAAPDAPARAEALWRMAACAAETGSLEEAERLYHETNLLAREIGHHVARTAALHSLAAAIYLRRGQFEMALAADEEAYQICSKHSFSEYKSYPLVTIGLCCLVTRRFERAHSAIAELGRIAQPASNYQGYFFCWSALVALEEGDINQGLSLLAQARSIAESTGEPGLNIHVYLGLSRAHRATGDAAAARDWAEEALAFVSRVGYRYERGNALIARSRAFWLQKNLEAAEADLRAALDILEELKAGYDLARARFFLAALLYQTKHIEAEAAWLLAVRALVEGGFTFFLEQERAVAFPLVAAHLANPNPKIIEPAVLLLSYLEQVPPPSLRVITLGRFEVYRQGQLIPVGAWHRQAGELFRLLLLQTERSLSRDQIIEALWPGKELSAAIASFHQATSALRRALEPDLPDKFPSRYLHVEEGRATLCLPAGSQVDFETFEKHFQEGEFEAALSIYQGEPFPKDRYQDWAAWKREQLNHHYIVALLNFAGQRLEAGETGQAVDACQRILAEDPWQEQAVMVAMRACIQAQDRITALRLYRDFERSLFEEFGITPTDELKRLYHSVQ